MTTTIDAPAESLIDRCRKLLAKAEAIGVTEAESEIYTARAAELMARHGINKAMLAAREAKTAPVKPQHNLILIDRPYPHQKKDLVAWTGDAMRLQPVIRHLPGVPEKYRETLGVELFGSAFDIERCRVMYESLLAQATRLIRDDLGPGRGSAYNQTWLNGFAHRVTERIKEAEQKVVSLYDTEHRLTGTQQSAALVLASWDDQVTAYRATIHPKLGKAKPRRSSGTGFHAGYAAGGRATLGQAGIGAGPARAITKGD